MGILGIRQLIDLIIKRRINYRTSYKSPSIIFFNLVGMISLIYLSVLSFKRRVERRKGMNKRQYWEI